MGKGSYWAIIYGCADIHAVEENKKLINAGDATDDVNDEFFDICDDLGLTTDTCYVGVMLLSTAEDNFIDDTVPIDKLPETIRATVESLNGVHSVNLAKAKATWKKLQERAAKLDINVPDGDLVWIADYE